MFRRNSAAGGPESREHGAMAGTGLALSQCGYREAARQWLARAGRKTRDPWLLEALAEICFQLGDLAQARRHLGRLRDVRSDSAFRFSLLIVGVDLTARPDQAAEVGEGPLTGDAMLAGPWKGLAGRGDARAMCCMGIRLALTGQREQARAWLERAAALMAEGPGRIPLSFPPSFGTLDADAQLGMLSGLLDPLVDGLRMD
jgi:tetratricopeptide (TPR) repeat protein